VKTYKAGLRTNIYYIIAFVIIIGVTILLSSKFSSGWILVIIFLLLFVLFNLISSRLNEIQLDKIENSLTVIRKNYIGIKRTFKYDLRQIEFAYKRQATSFRGGIKNVCTIYSANQKVFQLVPDDDDWSDDEIRSFVHGFIDSNVKKKFIGYSLKDVET